MANPDEIIHEFLVVLIERDRSLPACLAVDLCAEEIEVLRLAALLGDRPTEL
jgi:hypothetical protein